MRLAKMKVDYINDIPVHSGSKESVLNTIKENISGERLAKHICITNTESMYYAELLPEHLDYIKNAKLSLCDGVGSIIAGKFQGKNITRFNGPDLMLEACDYGQKHGWRHFFCGGKEGVAEKLVAKLGVSFPEMEVAGIYCPPFKELNIAEEREMIEIIKKSKPDIIWVGLGLLKQEAWIARYKDELNIPWGVGVGAAFDFYAGTVKRAPKFYRDIGMEWLYRVIREPRMFKRNVNSYKFMFKAIGKGINKKIFNKK